MSGYSSPLFELQGCCKWLKTPTAFWRLMRHEDWRHCLWCYFMPHYNELYGHNFDSPQFLEFGRYGVHLFFILSGFVIFMTLERTQSAGKFVVARTMRPLPALWISILFTFTIVSFIGPENRAVDFSTSLLNFTLLQNYLGEPHVDGAYWSLVIEATFYLWMALFFFTLKSWSTLQKVFRAWTILSYLAVTGESWLPEAVHFLLYDLSFSRYAPLFISGVLIYRWHKGHLTETSDILLLALAISHALIAYPSPFNLFVLASYGVFVLAVAGHMNFLVKAPLLWLGKLSYALYLVHQNIGYGAINWSYQQGWHGMIGVCLVLSVAFLLASAMHYGVEHLALQSF